MSRRGGVGTLGLLLAGLLLTTLTVVAEPRVIELTILAGTLPSDQRVIRVSQGDAVTLRFTSDRALTLHLHGYNIEQRLTPGTPRRWPLPLVPLDASRSRSTPGRAGMRRHSDYLEVHPR